MKINHFTLRELIESDTAKKEGIVNVPSFSQVALLERFVAECLEEIRAIDGLPIKVTSGYRCRELNAAVGGVVNSQHLCLGSSCAADITRGSIKANRQLFDKIKSSYVTFDQLILEKGGQWLHVSWSSKANRKEVLIG